MNKKFEKIVSSLQAQRETRLNNSGLIYLFEVRHGKNYQIIERLGENDIRVRYTWFAPYSYEQLIIKLIRTEYSIDQELAILRQRDSKPDEFNTYNDFVESCKEIAKRFVEERKEYYNAEREIDNA